MTKVREYGADKAELVYEKLGIPKDAVAWPIEEKLEFFDCGDQIKIVVDGDHDRPKFAQVSVERLNDVLDKIEENIMEVYGF